MSDNHTATANTLAYPDLIAQLRSYSDRSCHAAADIIEHVTAERDEARARLAALTDEVQRNIDWLDSTSATMHPMSTHAVANSLREALAAAMADTDTPTPNHHPSCHSDMPLSMCQCDTPEWVPDRCPTCSSDDPDVYGWDETDDCPDPWHDQ